MKYYDILPWFIACIIRSTEHTSTVPDLTPWVQGYSGRRYLNQFKRPNNDVTLPNEQIHMKGTVQVDKSIVIAFYRIPKCFSISIVCLDVERNLKQYVK